MFLIKQGATTTVAMLDLKGFEKELQVLSGTTDNVVRLDRLRARLGDAPEAWLPTFLAGGA
jgi:type IV secretion system protein VirB4